MERSLSTREWKMGSIGGKDRGRGHKGETGDKTVDEHGVEEYKGRVR